MASYPLRGLRVRLTVAVAATFALLLAVGAAALYAVLERHWRAEVDQTLDHSLGAARALFSSELAEYGTPQATVVHIVSELVFGDRSVVAVDPSGTRLAQSRPLEAAPDLWRVSLPSPNGGPITVMAPNGPSRVATTELAMGFQLAVGLTLVPMEERLRDLRAVLFLGVLASLAAGAAVALVVSRRVLTPVTAMAAMADRLREAVIRGEHPELQPVPLPTERDEVGRLQTAFVALVSRLEAAIDQERNTAANQRRFFADAAHELRTPVAILRNEIDTARLEAASPTQVAVLERLGREAQHLGQLVGDLLLLARGETAEDLESTAVIFLDDAASNAIVRASRLPAAAGRRIAVGRFDATPVRGDATLIERAVLALIENALLYAPGSDVEVSVGEGDGPRKTSWVRVTDWGPPIPDDAVERIFERFVRLRNDVPGSGLGLAIVRWVATIHGGTLRLEQEPAAGRKSFLLEMPAPESSVPPHSPAST
ncbi:MAG: HAMP domain-containing histidine kinase [Gemmatimonadetes bacterium]|nr:HAMP domain-containing histidine kinase [Gemmatimonadota bacterium]